MLFGVAETYLVWSDLAFVERVEGQCKMYPHLKEAPLRGGEEGLIIAVLLYLASPGLHTPASSRLARRDNSDIDNIGDAMSSSLWGNVLCSLGCCFSPDGWMDR